MTILFDLDGTLIDSQHDIAAAINRTRTDFGLPVRSFDEIIACVGDGMGNLIRRAIPELPESKIEEALKINKANYRAHLLDSTTLYPDVAESLRLLIEAGHRLGMVTNKPQEMLQPLLAGLNLGGYLQVSIGGGDCPELKPSALPLQLAAQRMGVQLTPEDWMVGDNVTDLEAARHAGIQSCFCRYGFGTAGDSPFTLAVDNLLEFARYVCF